MVRSTVVRGPAVTRLPCACRGESVTAIVTARINRNPFMRMPFLLESGIHEAHLFNDPFGGNVPCQRRGCRGSLRVVNPGRMGGSSEKQEADSPPRNRQIGRASCRERV